MYIREYYGFFKDIKSIGFLYDSVVIMFNNLLPD